MQENFVIHTDYLAHKSVFYSFLTNFLSQGEDVVRGERNAIKKIQIDGVFFNVKKFKNPSLIQSLVYRFLRKSKAKRSYEYALQLLQKGIKTPTPVGYFERISFGLKESYYISVHVDYDFDFRVLNHHPKFEDRENILTQFGRFCYQMHEAQVHFLDHSPGNTLINRVGVGQYEFYLIDLNRMRFETLSLDQRMKNLRRLWLSRTMVRIIATEYAKCYNTSVEKTQNLLQQHSKAFQDKVNRKKLRRRKRRK